MTSIAKLALFLGVIDVVIRKDNGTGINDLRHSVRIFVVVLSLRTLLETRDKNSCGNGHSFELETKGWVHVLDVVVRKTDLLDKIKHTTLLFVAKVRNHQGGGLLGVALVVRCERTLGAGLLETGTVWVFVFLAKMLLESFRIAKNLSAVTTEG